MYIVYVAYVCMCLGMCIYVCMYTCLYVFLYAYIRVCMCSVPDFGLGKIGNCLGPGGAWGPDLGPDLGPGKTSEILIELMNECIFISVTTTQLLQVEEQSIQNKIKLKN